MRRIVRTPTLSALTHISIRCCSQMGEWLNNSGLSRPTWRSLVGTAFKNLTFLELHNGTIDTSMLCGLVACSQLACIRLHGVKFVDPHLTSWPKCCPYGSQQYGSCSCPMAPW